ncbi:MAG: gliding motility protein GldN [Muribaculaceae bacterium]|nr:gliding motility protein GldN [Muribaculaceae bacterium]
MRLLTIAILLAATTFTSVAQDSQSSAVMRRGDRARKEAAANGTPQVTERMQQFMQTEEPSDADLQWMRVIYRQLDLTKDANTPLYFPDEPMEGQESLFRIIMRLLANDQIAAYEYLDGREVFTDNYKIKVRDMLERFHILHSDAKGSNDKHPKFVIDDSDVPANEVLNYYIIERWEFDKRSNRMKTRIEAICPVLSRSGDFGGEAVKYPMFWIKMDDLRPWLSTQNIFTDDDNNLATCTYADYFTLGLYDGEIYKTRNLRNQSLMQMYQDPESLKHAQDSIQHRLVTYEDKLWVPTLAELQKKREAEELAAAKAQEGENGEAVEEGKATEVKKTSTRSKRGSSSSSSSKKPAKVKKPKESTIKSSTSTSAEKSVRRRKR